MPNREVRLRRWQVVSAFVALVVVSALVIWWEDGRIDANARSSARAEVAATIALAQNQTQNAIRRELTTIFCDQINAQNARIRATVRVQPRKEFEEALLTINPNLTDKQFESFYLRAKEQELEVMERFAPVDCSRLPGT